MPFHLYHLQTIFLTSSKIFRKFIIRLQNIGRKGAANIVTSSVGYLSYHLFFDGPLYDRDTDWKVPGQ